MDKNPNILYLFMLIIILIILSCSNPSGLNLKNQNITGISDLNSGELIVHFIDIGQGDAILIQSPINEFVLIDTGSRTYSTTIINYLNDFNVHAIEAFIATHPHEDHIGSAQEIFEEFEINSVYHPGFEYSSATYARFLTSAELEGCPIYTDEQLDSGDYIPILSSVNCQILNINKDASNANDASIVLRVDYGAHNFLFTGDINGDKGDFVEAYITDNFNVNIDFLKVAHHGSFHSSTNYFLDEANPELSIISCGAGNSYGHPHSETLERLENHNSMIFRTDQNGNIKVTSNGVSFNVYYEKPYEAPVKPLINGENNGITGVTYSYSAKSFDPNGDVLFYQWNWGDGNITEWQGPYPSSQEVYNSHRWTQDGAYTIKVRVKDMYDHISQWGYFNTVMPRAKQYKLQKSQYILSNFKNIEVVLNKILLL
jgi:beta-lactamase superfamily II metal-dependent hydrolase